ncbi:hypothetical protein CR513_35333, partial [Mucuna pruriens]
MSNKKKLEGFKVYVRSFPLNIRIQGVLLFPALWATHILRKHSVWEFIFLADFVILDMEGKDEVAIILGLPYLATRRAAIDVEQEKLNLRLCNQEVDFKVFNLKNPSPLTSCNCMRALDISNRAILSNYPNTRKS